MTSIFAKPAEEREYRASLPVFISLHPIFKVKLTYQPGH